MRHAVVLLAKEGDDWRLALVGWAVSGELQVSSSLSLFSNSFCFAFSVICFDLVLDTKSFLLLLIILVGTSWIIPKPFTKDQNYWTYIN